MYVFLKAEKFLTATLWLTVYWNMAKEFFVKPLYMTLEMINLLKLKEVAMKFG